MCGWHNHLKNGAILDQGHSNHQTEDLEERAMCKLIVPVETAWVDDGLTTT